MKDTLQPPTKEGVLSQLLELRLKITLGQTEVDDVDTQLNQLEKQAKNLGATRVDFARVTLECTKKKNEGKQNLKTILGLELDAIANNIADTAGLNSTEKQELADEFGL